jgi:hypothetical protein
LEVSAAELRTVAAEVGPSVVLASFSDVVVTVLTALDVFECDLWLSEDSWCLLVDSGSVAVAVASAASYALDATESGISSSFE